MQLAIGTAQFRMMYGISCPSKLMSSDKIQQILVRAWEMGIRVLDTAPAYGDIENLLLELMGNHSFSVVSKIPAIPRNYSKDSIDAYINESIRKTQFRLGSHLQTLLFHCGEDLLSTYGEIIWASATSAIAGTSIQLGVSCYSPYEMLNICKHYPIQVAQIPGNAFDQRLLMSEISSIELHLRSVFLQGLLLLDPKVAVARLPSSAKVIQAWHVWCREKELTPLHAALSVVKGMVSAKYCIVGLDSLSHLEQIIEAWENTEALSAPMLAIENENIIDPRKWLINDKVFQ